MALRAIAAELLLRRRGTGAEEEEEGVDIVEREGSEWTLGSRSRTPKLD